MEFVYHSEPVEPSHQRLLPSGILGREPIAEFRSPFIKHEFTGGEAGVASLADPETLNEYERGVRSALWAAGRTAELIPYRERPLHVRREFYPHNITQELSRERREYLVTTDTIPIAIESSNEFQAELAYGPDEPDERVRSLFTLARPLEKNL